PVSVPGRHRRPAWPAPAALCEHALARQGLGARRGPDRACPLNLLPKVRVCPPGVPFPSTVEDYPPGLELSVNNLEFRLPGRPALATWRHCRYESGQVPAALADR